MQHIAAEGSGQIIGSLVATHNTLVEHGLVISSLTNLQYDPFIMHICGPARCRPLAKVYVLSDKEKKTTGDALDFLLPHGQGGVQVFQ